jgi:hypothetical protein
LVDDNEDLLQKYLSDVAHCLPKHIIEGKVEGRMEEMGT